MCGIAGIVTKAPMDAGEAQLLNRMSHALRHRGPDADGAWISSRRTVAFAHRRLSILDLSEAGAQPMSSHDGRWTICYNGEVYNHLELRSRFPGVTWRGHSDTETILEAVSGLGVVPALSLCNGMFAMALYDNQSHELWLVRDRFGVKPLYVGFQGGVLAFASELSAVADCLKLQDIGINAIKALLRWSYIPHPICVYRNAFQLPPDAVLRIDLDALCNSCECELYDILNRLSDGEDKCDKGAFSGRLLWNTAAQFNSPEAGSSRIEWGDAVADCEKLVIDAVRKRTISDVDIGAFLSGGIDSSLVVAAMQAVADRPVKTFTVGFDEASFDESAFAQRTANHLRCEHHAIILSEKEVLESVKMVPSLMQEPIGDSSFVPTYLVSKLAREFVTVALTGDGGDEIFLGYPRYRIMAPILAGRTKYPGIFGCLGNGGRVASATLRRLMHRRWAERIERLGAMLAESSFEDSYFTLCGVLESDRILNPDLRGPFGAPRRLPCQFADTTSRMAYADCVSVLPDDLLVKVDRASMAVGLECREPLLDYRLAQFAWSLPLEYKTRGGGKGILKSVLARYLPIEYINRPKKGFSVPLARWLRGPLKSWAEDLLFADTAAMWSVFDRKQLLRLWAEHQSGRRDHKTFLWNVIVLFAWLKQRKWSFSGADESQYI